MPSKRVIVVDDEPAARSNLRAVIESFDGLILLAEIGDGKTAIKEISTLQPDIVFLDIDMPEVNGFDVAAATSNVSYQLVFVTAYEQYALDAFDTRAIDYLLKPVRPSLVEKCIRKILRQEELVLGGLQTQKARSENLALSDGSVVRVINQSHINYIEGIGRYRRIHLTLAGQDVHSIQTIISDTTLEDFENQLPVGIFVRLHRSYLVNLSQIINLSIESRRYFVALRDTSIKIPVSRTKAADLKVLLQSREGN